MIKLEPGETHDGMTNNGDRPLYIGHHGEMNNVTDEVKPVPCYWCGKSTDATMNPDSVSWFVACKTYDCATEGPLAPDKNMAIQRWNSLAARLKLEPKKVTITRWVNVSQSVKTKKLAFGSLYDEEKTARQIGQSSDEYDYIDTVEVEITFTDRRGCE